ncbi:hypothetical protein Acsp02_95990 [Actinoplanes sp. NBRC 103695]|nr:hypothetical protein Acsp02_95990 [Actinoplanes sp. NBRC 103695]
MRVGTHHVGQHVRIGGVTFGPGRRKPVAIPGRLQRVDREHRVSSGDQRLHSWTPIGFNSDLDQFDGVHGVLAVDRQVLGDHRV